MQVIEPVESRLLSPEPVEGSKHRHYIVRPFDKLRAQGPLRGTAKIPIFVILPFFP